MTHKVNDMDLKLMSLFTDGYDRSYYIREVGKLLAISSRTALLTLDRLEKRGILASELRGKIKTYALRYSSITREFLIMAEQYKRIGFIEDNPVIGEVLDKASGFFGDIVAVFGSYSKGLQKKDSDLDLFVVGRHDKGNIRQIGKRYGIDVNIKAYPPESFKKGHDDILVKEVIRHHILIRGTEAFLEALWRSSDGARGKSTG